MPVVLFFAQAREAVGAGSSVFPGDTVQQVIDNVVAAHGQRFAEVLATSKVWVNGEEVPPSHPVTDKDEVAVLPPVSGGA